MAKFDRAHLERGAKELGALADDMKRLMLEATLEDAATLLRVRSDVEIAKQPDSRPGTYEAAMDAYRKLLDARTAFVGALSAIGVRPS